MNVIMMSSSFSSTSFYFSSPSSSSSLPSSSSSSSLIRLPAHNLNRMRFLETKKRSTPSTTPTKTFDHLLLPLFTS